MQWETATPVGFPVCVRHGDCEAERDGGWKIEGGGESAGCISCTISAIEGGGGGGKGVTFRRTTLHRLSCNRNNNRNIVLGSTLLSPPYRRVPSGV